MPLVLQSGVFLLTGLMAVSALDNELQLIFWSGLVFLVELVCLLGLVFVAGLVILPGWDFLLW